MTTFEIVAVGFLYHHLNQHIIHLYSFINLNRVTLFIRLPQTGAFKTLKDPPSNAMTAGEIVAAVFGFIALFALFAVAVIVIMRPPKSLEKYLGPPSANGGSSAGTEASRGFDNPLQSQVDAVEGGYNQ